LLKGNKKQAFKESVSDTLLALIINFPLNIFLLFVANRTFMPNMTSEAEQVFWTSVFLTANFTVVAIIRKTYTRLYFEEKRLKKMQK